MTTQPKQLTRRLAASDSQGVRGELIRGVLRETMPAGREHSKLAAKLSFLLGCLVWPRRLGELTTSDSAVGLERDADTVREPDIAYFSAAKSQSGSRVTGYSEEVPDLVVEVISPSDTQHEVSDKASMWLSYGVRLVWVVQLETGSVDIYRPDNEPTTIGEDDILGELDVLPGFICSVQEIFDT